MACLFYMMEEIILRCPHSANQVFEHISYDSLQNCLRVSKSFNHLINTDKNLWIGLLSKISKTRNRIFFDYSKYWKVILRSIKTQTVIIFAKQILQENELWNICFMNTPLDLILKFEKCFSNLDLVKVFQNTSNALSEFKNNQKNIRKSVKRAFELSQLLEELTKECMK